jgi:hypothetical protein
MNDFGLAIWVALLVCAYELNCIHRILKKASEK